MIDANEFSMKDAKEYKKTAPVLAVQMLEVFEVDTEEGVMTGRAGDYLCEGPAGERWPIKREIFEATYVVFDTCPVLDTHAEPQPTGDTGMIWPIFKALDSVNENTSDDPESYEAKRTDMVVAVNNWLIGLQPPEPQLPPDGVETIPMVVKVEPQPTGDVAELERDRERLEKLMLLRLFFVSKIGDDGDHLYKISQLPSGLPMIKITDYWYTDWRAAIDATQEVDHELS